MKGGEKGGEPWGCSGKPLSFTLFTPSICAHVLWTVVFSFPQPLLCLSATPSFHSSLFQRGVWRGGDFDSLYIYIIVEETTMTWIGLSVYKQSCAFFFPPLGNERKVLSSICSEQKVQHLCSSHSSFPSVLLIHLC